MVERKGIETARKSLIFKARHLSLCHGTPTGTPGPRVLWIAGDGGP